MVDLNDVDGDSSPSRRSASIEQNPASRLAEAAVGLRVSPFDGVDSLSDKMRVALGTSPFGRLALEREAAGGMPNVAKQLADANKRVADALRPHAAEYTKATSHLRDVFERSFVNDEVDKVLNGGSASREAARYIAEIEKSQHWPSTLDRLPPVPKLPPNPIFETNQHLEQVVDKIDALLDVQAKQAEMADALLKVHIESSKQHDRATRRSHRVAILSALLAALAIMVTFVS